MLALITQNATLILAVLFAISEALAMIPAVKANSVFQAIFNGLKFAKEKLVPLVNGSDTAAKQ